ncbi:MAG: GGDEF domain-containing protein [Gemmatimonadaceae bacterium]
MQLPITDDSEALRQAVRVSQAVNRVRQLPAVFVANPLLAGLLAIAYWGRIESAVLAGFTAVMVALWTPPALSWWRLRRRPRPADVSVNNERRALAYSLVNGLLWAAMALVLFPLGGPDERATLVMLLAGLCAGSVAFFSSSPVASMAFFLPFMSTLLVQAVRYDAAHQPILPSAIAVFILCALLFTKSSWRQFVENVRVLVQRDIALAESKGSALRLEAMLSQMSDLAMVDELTGLKNRRAFFDDAEPLIAGSRRRGNPISVAVVDLDNFKLVNDTYGHATGDHVLRGVADRIVETLRDEQIVGRFGGEEFVVLLTDTTPAQALMALERVRRALGEKPFVLPNGTELRVTGSGGIALMREGDTIKTAIDHADKAMYRAKALGRDRNEVFGAFEPGLGV